MHQIDNARDFVDMGGLDIVKDLTSSLSDGGSPHEIPLISEAIRILGSSSQSNAKVQVRVLKEGFLPLLLKQIQWQYQCHVAQSPQFSLGIFSRLFYAISALVRHFPKAQKDFIEAEGLVVLTDVMKDASVAPKMHFKILTLVNDLLTERVSLWGWVIILRTCMGEVVRWFVLWGMCEQTMTQGVVRQKLFRLWRRVVNCVAKSGSDIGDMSERFFVNLLFVIGNRIFFRKNGASFYYVSV